MKYIDMDTIATTPLLKEQDLAKLINMTLHTIRKWRCYGGGPRFIKIGSAVRYRAQDVELWLQELESNGDL
jgi:predicted DNA-binding transcriptional regulator AlpA